MCTFFYYPYIHLQTMDSAERRMALVLTQVVWPAYPARPEAATVLAGAD